MASHPVRTTFGSTAALEAKLDDTFDFSSLYGEFRDEASDQIGLLDAALLRVEDEGALPEEERAALLRALHTLKGNAGMLGRKEIADAVHDLETVFKDVREEWDRGVLDGLFELAAVLRRAIDRVGAEEEDGAMARVRAVRQAVGRVGGEQQGVAQGDHGLGPRLRGDDEEKAEDNRGEGGRVGGNAGGDGGEAREDQGLGPRLRGDDEEQVEDEEKAANRGRREPADRAGDIVRVPFARLDALLNRVGELVTLEARMDELLRHRRADLKAAGLRRPIEEAAEGLARLAGSLHETTMELRLVPIHRVFERFRTVVRDLARREGKRVRLEMAGEAVRIDKAMADAISEPLLHLVRNAVDHGIEDPEERERQGRDPVGTIWLRAERRGDRVRIEVEDDGRGLDHAGILARARDLELVDAEDPRAAEAVGDLIFRPGFSTRTEATTVSGRGVGLDVVRRKAVALRGSLAVESPEQGGTRFVLDLPLTMAIVPAVLFEAAGEVLAFAATDVVETLRSPTIERAGGAEVVRRGDELVPVAGIVRIFGWTDHEPGGEDAPFAVVVGRAGRQVAVPANRLLDQRDVVVKALPAFPGPLAGVSGVAVTHEGAVVLLLDVDGVLDLNLEQHRRENRGT